MRVLPCRLKDRGHVDLMIETMLICHDYVDLCGREQTASVFPESVGARRPRRPSSPAVEPVPARALVGSYMNIFPMLKLITFQFAGSRNEEVQGIVQGWGYNYFIEMCSGSEAGSYSRLIDV